MDEATLKLKRQVRDHYNKNVHDESIINKIARLIGYTTKEKENDNSSR